MVPQAHIGKPLNFLSTLVIFLALLGSDQLSKSLITDPILNLGFILSSMENASAFYRVFCISILLAIAIITLSLLQYLVWKTLPRLVLALVFLESGLLGNGIDKLRIGAVRDFIPLPFTSLFFNLADVFLWIGTAAILVMVWAEPEKIWRKNELRSSLMIFPKTQLRVIGILILIVSLTEGGMFLLITAYLKSNGIEFLLSEASVSAALFLLLSALIVSVFGVVWSHRMFGPFRAIERFIQTGKESKMRASDDNECVRDILILLKNKNS